MDPVPESLMRAAVDFQPAASLTDPGDPGGPVNHPVAFDAPASRILDETFFSGFPLVETGATSHSPAVIGFVPPATLTFRPIELDAQPTPEPAGVFLFIFVAGAFVIWSVRGRKRT
jgi:hypothetical protein